jgi:cyanophycinase-like exopeptidase
MHGDDQVAKSAASMASFGWTLASMVADTGEPIAGHGRVPVATMLGLSEVPMIRLSQRDEAERRACRIADAICRATPFFSSHGHTRSCAVWRNGVVAARACRRESARAPPWPQAVGSFVAQPLRASSRSPSRSLRPLTF